MGRVLGFGWAPHPAAFMGEGDEGRVADYDSKDFRVDPHVGELLPVFAVF